MEAFLYEGRCANVDSPCSLVRKTIFACSLCASGNLPSSNNKRGYISHWKYVARHASSAYHVRKLNDCQSIVQDLPEAPQENHDDGPLGFDDADESMEQNHSDTPTISELARLGFDSKSQTPYFLHYELKEKGLGMRYITGKAFGVSPHLVSEDEARFCLQTCSLLIGLTERQKELLATILTTAGNNGNSDLSIFNTIRLPTSTEDFEKFFLVGKRSILSNLPHPIPRSTDDSTHSFVSLKDLLANEIGKATRYDEYDFMAKVYVGNDHSVPSISSTSLAKRMLIQMKEKEDMELNKPSTDEYTIYLWVREWRDDFDPNNTKSSRNQVWCNTYTISPPTSGNTYGSNTYFMGLSSKGDEHREVEEILAQEMDALSKNGLRLYHGGMRRIITVRINKLLISVDRPERTSMFQVGDHNGTYSTCWGFATHVDGSCQVNHLPSCQECRKKREKRLMHQIPISSDNHAIKDEVACSACSDWLIEDPKFVFLAPSDYPQRFDSRDGSPPPPKDRGLWARIEDIPTSDDPTQDTNHTNQPDISSENEQRHMKKRKKKQKKPMKRIYLRTVRLSVTWLRTAVCFACHQIRTSLPGGRAGQMFWNKGNFSSYLKTCGLTNRLIDVLFSACSNEVAEFSTILPVCWNDLCSLAKCHYAPMHMLFLGHMKSNIEMVSNWLGKFNRLASFGKEANKYLIQIRSLRATKFFNAQPLSTSSWGTGVWVSENYLLGARIWKFLMSLPSISKNQVLTNESYRKEWMAIVRFMHAMSMAFTRLMTNKKDIPMLKDYILIYMDQMVIVDRILADSDRQKKNPNYVKSNSLGILTCAEAHEDMGPAVLHWEGGWEGERKIQQMKPLLNIKRSNADWTKISLTRLYQHDTLQWMLQQMPASSEKIQTNNRSNESLIKIYKNRQELQDACDRNSILSVIYGIDEQIYAAYRPIGEDTGNTRRKIKIVRIGFDDNNGEWTSSRCWTAPIRLEDESRVYESIHVLQQHVIDEVVLLLPQMNEDALTFKNMYFGVGNKWRERSHDGLFRHPVIDNTLFGDENHN